VRRETLDDEDFDPSWPPLHRSLIPKQNEENLDEKESEGSSPSRSNWDNGAQGLLNDLGYVRSNQHQHGDGDESVTRDMSLAENGNQQHRSDQAKTGYLDQVIPRDRRVTRIENQRSNSSAICIQAVVRGYLARRSCMKLRIEREKQQHQRATSPGRLHQTIKSQSSVIQSLKSFSLTENLKSLSRTFSSPSNKNETSYNITSMSPTKSSPSPSQKTLLRVLSREISSAVDQSVQVMKNVSETVVTKYQEQTEQRKEMKERDKVETQRKERIQNNEFCIEDAVFNVKGCPVEIPRLNRFWYLGVFPQLDEYEVDHETVRSGEMLSGHDLEQAYEMVHDRIIDEAVRTPPLSPFSKETYQRMNFNLHLADLQRYTRLLVVIFVETSEESESGRMRPDVLPNHVAVPNVKKGSRGNDEIPKFLPLFFGSCQLNGGLAFSPCGGRLVFHLHPNPNPAIIFSKSQAKRISGIKRLELQATLIPVAVPSSKFLSSLSDPQATLPHYPGELLDGFLFEKHEVQVKEFYGAAICMLRFNGRNLVSTRHRGVPNGIAEFSLEGKYLGKAIEYREDLGTISTMTNGKYHFLCGGSTGAIAIYSTPDDEEVMPTELPHSSLPPFSLIRFQALHHWPIVLSGCLHRAGLDFFFTIDRQNFLGVVILEQKTCLRTYLNEPFVSDKITCCQLVRDRLYLGLQNGSLVTINILPLLSGQMDCGKRLSEYVIDREIIFADDCGISAMSVMASADYFGLLHEDLDPHHLASSSQMNESFTSTNVRIKPKPKSKLFGRKPVVRPGPISSGVVEDESIYEKNSKLRPGRPLEGHILLIAGGDKNPIVKILHPNHPKPATGSAFHQIGELPGHGKAVTQIVCDVAGRFIITCSQGSKSIAIWNGITFNCERTHEEVNIGSLGVSDNALFGCSFKAPFVTIWKPLESTTAAPMILEPVPVKEKKRRVVESSRSNGSDLFDEDLPSESMSIELSPDGRPEIAMVRTSVWCLTTVTGGKIIPQKSLAMAAFQYLGDSGRRVVTDWHASYNRAIKKIAKVPPKRSHTSLKKALSLPPIQEKAKKKELQRLASGVTGYSTQSVVTPQEIPQEGNELSFGTQSQVVDDLSTAHQTPSFSTATAAGGYDWRTGYDYTYGCYYDEHGYAYNYDQSGNYFYYDAAWYEQFSAAPQQNQPTITSPLLSRQHSAPPPSGHNTSRGADYVVDPGLGALSSIINSSDSFVTDGLPFVSQDDLNGTMTMTMTEFLQIGDHDVSQSPETPQPLPDSQFQTPSRKKAQKVSQERLEAEEDYDRYGKYIGSDLDRYDSDGPPETPWFAQRGSQMTDGRSVKSGGSKQNSLPTVSLRRRHMHMSDSESDEEDKLESIYRARPSRPSREGSQSERSEGEQRGMSWRELERHQQQREENDEGEEEENESVVSLSRERKNYLEREKFIQRGLLHHLADDDSEEEEEEERSR
jgi:hypothetical protein